MTEGQRMGITDRETGLKTTRKRTDGVGQVGLTTVSGRVVIKVSNSSGDG